MNVSRKTSFAAGAIVALVLGSGTAYAATGGNLILGKVNRETSTTSIQNPRGTALGLASRPGTPALKVSNRVKVPRLNADLLDGADSSAFASVRGRTGFVSSGGAWVDLDEDGTNDVMLAVAQCPAGTQLTGGGESDFTADGQIVDSSPLGGGGWVVMAVGIEATDNAADLLAYAVCYNPRGPVRGAAPARSTAGTAEAENPLEAYKDMVAGMELKK